MALHRHPFFFALKLPCQATLQVRRSITFVGHRPVEGEPKTRSGNRTLYLPSFVVTALKAQRARQAGYRLGAGEAWRGEDRVFTTQTGAPPTRCSLAEKYRAACLAAGVPECRIHDLRHVHATLAVRSGTDPKALQKHLGHASLAMTLGLYAKAVSEADRDTAAGLERLLTGQPAKRAQRR